MDILKAIGRTLIILLGITVMGAIIFVIGVPIISIILFGICYLSDKLNIVGITNGQVLGAVLLLVIGSVTYDNYKEIKKENREEWRN